MARKNKGKKRASARGSDTEAPKGAATPGNGASGKAKAGGGGGFRPDRRLVLRSAGAVGVLLAGGYALHRHDTTDRRLHDLAVIGDGAPSVVQIHDPSCPLCRRLKSATEKALEGRPHVRYRLADITRADGRELQREHGVATVTLLLFDGRGRRVDTVSGVQSVEALRAVFDERFGEGASGTASNGVSPG